MAHIRDELDSADCLLRKPVHRLHLKSSLRKVGVRENWSNFFFVTRCSEVDVNLLECHSAEGQTIWGRRGFPAGKSLDMLSPGLLRLFQVNVFSCNYED